MAGLISTPKCCVRTISTSGYMAANLSSRQVHGVEHIPFNERVMSYVRPRVPVRTLARLLAISNEAPTAVERLLRRYLLTSAETPFLLDLYATSLLKALEPLQTGGLYRRYERVQQDTSYPRGRILLGETIRRHQ